MPKLHKTLNFGAYQGTPIKWYVVYQNTKTNNYLLISQFILQSMPFSDQSSENTWETSPIRNFLNTTFINEAFSEDEKSQILETNVITSNKQNSYQTKDKIFIPSYNDIKKYLTIKKIQALSTDYAFNNTKLTYRETKFKNKTTNKFDYKHFTQYWLRNNGVYPNTATYVDTKGNIIYGGANIHTYFGIRPCLWVNLPSGLPETREEAEASSF